MDQTTQAKYLELESLRSRKVSICRMKNVSFLTLLVTKIFQPLFQRLRIALTSNRDLVGKLKSQNGKIGQLKREAKLLDSMLASLEEEQLLVREKTQALLQVCAHVYACIFEQACTWNHSEIQGRVWFRGH